MTCGQMMCLLWQTFRKGFALTHYNSSRKAASDIFAVGKIIIFVKQKHHFRLWRIHHFFRRKIHHYNNLVQLNYCLLIIIKKWRAGNCPSLCYCFIKIKRCEFASEYRHQIFFRCVSEKIYVFGGYTQRK